MYRKTFIKNVPQLLGDSFGVLPLGKGVPRSKHGTCSRLVQCFAFPAFPITPEVFGEGRRRRKQVGSSVPLSPCAKQSHRANTSAGAGCGQGAGAGAELGASISSQRKPWGCQRVLVRRWPRLIAADADLVFPCWELQNKTQPEWLGHCSKPTSLGFNYKAQLEEQQEMVAISSPLRHFFQHSLPHCPTYPVTVTLGCASSTAGWLQQGQGRKRQEPPQALTPEFHNPRQERKGHLVTVIHAANHSDATFSSIHPDHTFQILAEFLYFFFSLDVWHTADYFKDD